MRPKCTEAFAVGAQPSRGNTPMGVASTGRVMPCGGAVLAAVHSGGSRTGIAESGAVWCMYLARFRYSLGCGT